MKKNIIKKIAITLLLTTSIFALVGCNNIKNKKITVTGEKINLSIEDTNVENQRISINDWSFEIPSNWKKIDTEAKDAYSYAPIAYEEDTNSSNVNVVIQKSDSQPSITDLMNNINEALLAQIVEVMPTATNFKYDNFKSNMGDVLAIEYDVSNSGIDMHTTQFLVLCDGYSVAVTSINIGDDISPAPESVAKHIVTTLKK